MRALTSAHERTAARLQARALAKFHLASALPSRGANNEAHRLEERERKMTRTIRSITLTALATGILTLAGVQSASAQVDYPLKFTTTFPFTVGYATVPAGTYTITQDDDNPQLLELTGGRVSVFFQTNNADAKAPASKSEIVFKHYGNRYVLKDLWVAGSTSGAESVAAEGERHMAKRYASPGERRVAARKH